MGNLIKIMIPSSLMMMDWDGQPLQKLVLESLCTIPGHNQNLTGVNINLRFQVQVRDV